MSSVDKLMKTLADSLAMIDAYTSQAADDNPDAIEIMNMGCKSPCLV